MVYAKVDNTTQIRIKREIVNAYFYKQQCGFGDKKIVV